MRPSRHSRARAITRRARGALALNLDGVLERLDQPALFVTGRLDRLIPWESTERQALAAPQGELVVSRMAITCARTCPSSLARWWRTGSRPARPVWDRFSAAEMERRSARARALCAATTLQRSSSSGPPRRTGRAWPTRSGPEPPRPPPLLPRRAARRRAGDGALHRPDESRPERARGERRTDRRVGRPRPLRAGGAPTVRARPRTGPRRPRWSEREFSMGMPYEHPSGFTGAA